MNKSNLFIIVVLVGVIGFLASSPSLRALVGLRASETVSIQRASQSDPNANGKSGENAQPPEEQYELVTLLPKDAIRSIDNPKFVTGAEADEQYSPDELVLGVEIDGDVRAYSIPFLSGHEIVNDVVGGEPIAVTW